MARTSLSKTKVPGSYAGNGVALTMAAADATNDNQFSASGDDLVFAHNTDTAAQTVTVTSAPDSYGRTKDIASESIPAGKIHVFGPFKLPGWVQSDGKIYLSASAATVEFGILDLNK